MTDKGFIEWNEDGLKNTRPGDKDARTLRNYPKLSCLRYSPFESGCVCTRKAEHKGLHIAAGLGGIYARWSQT
jgi:hypothetical protein